MPTERHPEEPGSGFPLLGQTAQEFNQQMAGGLRMTVPRRLPPPGDMPPLPLMVLEELADDAESIYTMRLGGDMAANGLELVGEAHLLDAVRSLLADGLVEVESEFVVLNDRIESRSVNGDPATSDSDLQRYWLRMTPAGEQRLEAAESVLDEYWATHPMLEDPYAPAGAAIKFREPVGEWIRISLEIWWAGLRRRWERRHQRRQT